MKYSRIVALLGLSEMVLHSNLFGGKAFAKLSEDELEKINAALEEKDTKALEEELAAGKENMASIQDAVEQALEHAGLEAKGTLQENIVLLGQKCREYGDSKNRHNFPENNGKDEPTNGLEDGYLDPEDSHNKLIKNL
jgi:hypothetical protein